MCCVGRSPKNFKWRFFREDFFAEFVSTFMSSTVVVGNRILNNPNKVTTLWASTFFGMLNTMVLFVFLLEEVNFTFEAFQKCTHMSTWYSYEYVRLIDTSGKPSSDRHQDQHNRHLD